MVRHKPPAMWQVQAPSTNTAARMVVAMSMFAALATDKIRLSRISAHVECAASRRTYLVFQ